jgi:hypothetical protein
MTEREFAIALEQAMEEAYIMAAEASGPNAADIESLMESIYERLSQPIYDRFEASQHPSAADPYREKL